MKYIDKLNIPHAIYRLYNRDGDLLYVGVSHSALNRITTHTRKSWGQDIQKITLEWVGGYVLALQTEAEAILAEKPKYNRATLLPDQVGHPPKPPSGKKRGDGIHCPKCGKEKERKLSAYCKSCYLNIQHERKRAQGWVPKEERPPVPCPRCLGPKEPEPSYCKPCTRAYNRDRRHRQQVPGLNQA